MDIAWRSTLAAAVLAATVACSGATPAPGAGGNSGGQGGAGGAGGAVHLTPQATEVGPFVAGVHGIALSPDGVLYFSDSFANHASQPAVYQLRPPYTGVPEATGITGPRPAGLLWHESSLYVCDPAARTVVRHDGAFVAQQVWSDVAAWNVAAHPTLGLVAVDFAGKLIQLHPDDTTTELFGGTLAPFDVAVDPNGELWLTEQGAAPGRSGARHPPRARRDHRRKHRLRLAKPGRPRVRCGRAPLHRRNGARRAPRAGPPVAISKRSAPI